MLKSSNNFELPANWLKEKTEVLNDICNQMEIDISDELKMK